MKQEYKNKNTQKREEEVELVDPPTEQVETNVDEDELTDLLDEIDDVLEENAEEFVQNYVQKGGE